MRGKPVFWSQKFCIPSVNLRECLLAKLFENYFQEALCLLGQLAHKSIEILFYSIYCSFLFWGLYISHNNISHNFVFLTMPLFLNKALSHPLKL